MRGNEVNTILSDLYGQIEYELRDDYEDGLEKAMQELERYKNIIERIQSIYTSMQFSAPENMYVFIDQLGEILEELKGE